MVEKSSSLLCFYFLSLAFSMITIASGDDLPPKCHIMDGTDFSGFTYSDAKAYQLEDCIKLCNTDARCKFWSWVKPAQRCFFRESITGRKEDSNYQSGEKCNPSTTDLPPKCHIMDRTDYSGDWYSDTKADQVEDCIKLCSADERCKFWSWAKPTKRCFFRGSVTGTKEDSYYQSGEKCKPSTTDLPPKCHIMDGTDLLGFTYSDAKAYRLEDCIKLCNTDARCKFWSWVKPAQRCFFRESITGRKEDSNYQSGEKCNPSTTDSYTTKAHTTEAPLLGDKKEWSKDKDMMKTPVSTDKDMESYLKDLMKTPGSTDKDMESYLKDMMKTSVSTDKDMESYLKDMMKTPGSKDKDMESYLKDMMKTSVSTDKDVESYLKDLMKTPGSTDKDMESYLKDMMKTSVSKDKDVESYLKDLMKTPGSKDKDMESYLKAINAPGDNKEWLVSLNTEYIGGKSIGNDFFTSKVQDCIKSCDKHDTCRYWMWVDDHVGNKKCYLKETIDGKKEKPNSMVGHKCLNTADIDPKRCSPFDCQCYCSSGYKM